MLLPTFELLVVSFWKSKFEKRAPISKPILICKFEVFQRRMFVFYYDEIKFKSVIPVIGPSGSAEKQFETESIQTIIIFARNHNYLMMFLLIDN